MAKDKKKVDEKNENLLAKMLPSILTATAIIVGVWQFNAEQTHRDNDLFRQKIWAKKLEFYEKLGNATAKVVNSTADTIAFDAAIKEFNNLYWGVLPMIQDDNVEKAIIRFNSEIRYFKRQESSVNELRTRGYNVMIECKTSLDNSWELLLEND